IESLDYQVPAEIQRAMMKELIQLQTRASWWLLRRRRNDLNIQSCIDAYQHGIEQTVATLDRLQQSIPSQDRWQAKFQRYTEMGVPEQLSAYTAASEGLYWLLDIIEVAAELKREVSEVSPLYFKIGEHLNLPWLDRQIRTYQATSHWQALARNSYRDDLDAQQRALTISALRDSDPAQPQAAIDAWLEKHRGFINRWQSVLSDMQSSPSVDCAIFTVAISVLFELA
ncbi:MAG: NAD-glutamate dehydrogenase, partial [Halopseudomonas sp.]